jgi:hypothetical protein
MKNPVTMLKDLAGRLAGARDALSALHDTDKGLRTLHEGLMAERARLVGSQPPRVELIATAEAAIDAVAATWAAEHGPRVVSSLAGYVDMQPDGAVRGFVAGSLWPALTGQDAAQLFAALWPDQAKQGLRRVIDATDYAEGPPIAGRPRLIAEVDAKILDVEEQHSSLVDQARELGITLELLPDVRQRRAHAAHLDEFRERAARDLAPKVRR